MPDVAAILEQETTLLASFVTLLTREQEILKLAEVKKLPEINEQKSNLVAQLNDLAFARGEALDLVGTQNTPAATTARLASRAVDQTTASRWKEVLELARQAKQLHELNGRLIQMHLQHTNELLAALTQQSENHTLYGSSGQTCLSTGSRIVDSA